MKSSGWFNNITILHWLPVKTGKSGSRVTVYGGNEALASYRFKQLPESHISQFLLETSVWLFLSKNINFNTALLFYSSVWIYNFIHNGEMTWRHSKHESHLTPPGVRWDFLAPVKMTEKPVWYARTTFIWWIIIFALL